MPEVNPDANEDELRAIDRELSQLLAVEPSPEFAAKVRLQIQQEPARRLGWQWWAVGTLAAAALVAVLLAAATRETVPMPTSVHADVSLPAPHVKEEPATHPAREALPTPRSRFVDHRRSTSFEIVIDPALAAAVRRLATEQPYLPEVPPEPSLDPVVVEPLKVPDIADAGAKQGDRQ
jgi:hypothetical protein